MDYKVRSTSNDWKARSEVRKPKHGLQGTLDIKRFLVFLLLIWLYNRLMSSVPCSPCFGFLTPDLAFQSFDVERHQTIGKPDQK
jgi:hypothetical protein